MTRYRIGVDLGGTKILTVLLDENNHIVSEDRRMTQAARGPKAVIETLIASVEGVVKQGGIYLSDVKSIGVGSPGPLNTKTGVVLCPPNLPGFVNLPLRDTLSAHFARPVYLDNDANAAGIAEWRLGAGRGTEDMVYITVSTGIGGAAIVRGRIQHGESGSAGEFGHIILDPRGPHCNCGNDGCLEAVSSGTAIARSAREQAHRFGLEPEVLTTEKVFVLYNEGHPAALEIINRAIDFLAIGVTNLIHLYNPQRVVIGGGVASVGDVLFQPLRRGVKSRVFAHLSNTPIVPAELGGEVGALGAALLGE